MRKMIKNIGICLFGMLLFVACFDDDGNYDYKTFEDPVISFTFSQHASAYIGEPIIYEPIIRNDSLINLEDYSWEYHFMGYGLVCTTRVMNMVFPDIKEARSVPGIVRAINRKTGQYATYNTSFKYLNLWDKGWCILSDDNGVSKLNLVKTRDDSIWTTDKDLTQMLNQTILGSGPKKLIVSNNQRKEVRVLQNSGDVILQHLRYYSLGTFEDEFSSGTYPNSFVPKSFNTAGNVAAILGEDGRVFSKIFNSAAVYTAEKFLDNALQYNGRVLNVEQIYTISPSTSAIKHLLMYDRDSANFFILGGNGFNANTGGVYPIRTVKVDTIVDEVITDSLTYNDTTYTKTYSLMNLSAYDMVYSQLVNSSSTTLSVFSVLKEKNSSNYYYHTFTVKANKYDEVNLAVTDAFTPVPGEIAALMKTGTKYHMPRSTSATQQHLYIVSPDYPTKLYVTNVAMQANAVVSEYKEFDSPITVMNSQHVNHNSLGLGLENGKFYILNITLDVITDLAGMESEKVKWETQVDGKIIDLCWKSE